MAYEAAMPPARVTRGLPRAVLIACLALPGPGARAADPALKACVASCNDARVSCLAEAAANAAAAFAACAGATDPDACEATAKRLEKAGKKACKSARKGCKRCCKKTPGSCVQPPELPVFAGSFERPEREALTTALEESGFPPGPEGRGFAVLRLPDGVFFIDPERRSPASAAGECADAILACVAPPERNLAGCFAALATCKGKPWKGDHAMCCPKDCGERYQALRREGRDEGMAFAGAIFAEPSCIPGVRGQELGP